jgi:internalin A
VPDASIKAFTEWCEERAELPPGTIHTVDQLLLLTGTKDWAAADALISQQEPLGNNPIPDIAPLTNLGELEELLLFNTEVADISPLQSLYAPLF